MILWRVITTKLREARVVRIGIIFFSWLIVREASLRANGFIDGTIVCPIRLLTGVPCPACGTTRSLAAISVGRFEDAWLLNPLGFAVIAFAILWALRLEPLKKFWSAIVTTFHSKSLKFKVVFLIGFYLLAWIASLIRLNTAILQ